MESKRSIQSKIGIGVILTTLLAMTVIIHLIQADYSILTTLLMLSYAISLDITASYLRELKTEYSQ